MSAARAKRSSKAPGAPKDSEPKPRSKYAGRDRSAWTRFLVASSSLLVLDLLVKFLAFAYVQPTGKIIVIPYVLAMQLTWNQGAVFGLGQGQKWFFVLVSVVALAVIGRVFWKSDPKSRWFHFSLAMILSGALGNLYDRIRFGAVRDMFKIFPDVYLPFGLKWGPGVTEIYPWIFNIADMALLFGVGMLIVILWRDDRKKQKAKADDD